MAGVLVPSDLVSADGAGIVVDPPQLLRGELVLVAGLRPDGLGRGGGGDAPRSRACGAAA